MKSPKMAIMLDDMPYHLNFSRAQISVIVVTALMKLDLPIFCKLKKNFCDQFHPSDQLKPILWCPEPTVENVHF